MRLLVKTKTRKEVAALEVTRGDVMLLKLGAYSPDADYTTSDGSITKSLGCTKFDLNKFAILTSINGNLKGCTCEEGYIRTSSRNYSPENLANRLVHLTNDSRQSMSECYGKFEPGNKLGYDQC